MFKRLFVTLSILAGSTMALMAQDTPAGVITKDEFTGQSRIVSHPGKCDVEGSNVMLFNAKNMFIEAWRIKDEGKDEFFKLRVVLVQKSFINVMPGDALILLVDGERLVLKSDAGSVGTRFVVNGQFCREDVWCNADIETLRKICNGKVIKVKLNGTAFAAIGEVTKDGLKNLRLFGETHLK
jgi:hypothetical protein